MDSYHQLIKFHNHYHFSQKLQNITIQFKLHNQYQKFITHQYSNISNDLTSDLKHV